MLRLNLVLLLAVMASAIFLVHNQYESRRLFTELDRAVAESRRLATEHPDTVLRNMATHGYHLQRPAQPGHDPLAMDWSTDA